MSLLDDLRAVVGNAHVVTDEAITASYTRDWTGRFSGAARAVVRPADVDEVASVLAACNDAGVAVVPQGGNTGLVAGAVPERDEILLSLRRLDELGAVDRLVGQVTVGAGVTIATLRAHAHDAGWEYGVDLAARDSATVGGTIATNAGGLHVLRYGPTRRQVVGYEAVLADGTRLRRLDGLEKDNTGYDLAALLCGSEGTLAVVTAARLRLVPRSAHVVVALIAFASVDDAVAAASVLRRTLDSLSAVELFVDDGLRLVCDRLALPPPFPVASRAYLLVECAAAHDPTDELAAATGTLADRVEVGDIAVASDPERRAALWRYREGHTEAINLLGAPHKLDVTLPGAVLASFVDVVPGVVARALPDRPDARVWLFGHAADGNVHVNVTGVDPDDDRVADAVLHLVAEMGGSISAEHGIGTAKRRWVHLTRTPQELAAMRAIKRALDPRDILNPRVLFPDDGVGSEHDDA
ncbi:MAG TPA: FAD-binding oxidoreductase [Acidimicrobiia bacterium]|nr:FAD-binding oxidoreductase [Acidimicrobiia bacterium]